MASDSPRTSGTYSSLAAASPLRISSRHGGIVSCPCWTRSGPRCWNTAWTLFSTSASGAGGSVTTHEGEHCPQGLRSDYRVVCDEVVARTRCLARNTNPVGVFLVDALAFDTLRAKFELLGPDEPHELIDTTPPPQS